MQASQHSSSAAYAAALFLSGYQFNSLLNSITISASSVSSPSTTYANAAAVLFEWLSGGVGWLRFLTRTEYRSRSSLPSVCVFCRRLAHAGLHQHAVECYYRDQDQQCSKLDGSCGLIQTCCCSSPPYQTPHSH